MTKPVDREVVSIGIDFRPIPMDVGDGNVWNFHPDPPPSDIDSFFRALRKVGRLGKQISSDEADESVGMKSSLGELHKALGGLLIDPKQKTEWAKTQYGLGVLSALSNALIENVTGFSRESPKPSGKG